MQRAFQHHTLRYCLRPGACQVRGGSGRIDFASGSSSDGKQLRVCCSTFRTSCRRSLPYVASVYYRWRLRPAVVHLSQRFIKLATTILSIFISNNLATVTSFAADLFCWSSFMERPPPIYVRQAINYDKFRPLPCEQNSLKHFYSVKR